MGALKFGKEPSVREMVLSTLTQLKTCLVNEDKQTALRTKKLRATELISVNH
jgi:hypothetical protein